MSWGHHQFKNTGSYIFHKLANRLRNFNLSGSELYLPGTLKWHKGALLDNIFCSDRDAVSALSNMEATSHVGLLSI